MTEGFGVLTSDLLVACYARNLPGVNSPVHLYGGPPAPKQSLRAKHADDAIYVASLASHASLVTNKQQDTPRQPRVEAVSRPRFHRLKRFDHPFRLARGRDLARGAITQR